MKHEIIESFFSCSQRLTDMSKTIRAKQLQCLGKLSSEDLTPALRRLEKQHKIDFSTMPLRTWFFEGKTFVSPTFKQSGKQHIINRAVKQEWLDSLPKEKVLSLKDKIKLWFNPQSMPNKTQPLRTGNLENNPNSLFESEEEEREKQDLENENLI